MTVFRVCLDNPKVLFALMVMMFIIIIINIIIIIIIITTIISMQKETQEQEVLGDSTRNSSITQFSVLLSSP